MTLHPPKLSPLRAAMERLEARLNGADRRALRRAQAKVTGKKEGFAAMSARLTRDAKKEKSKGNYPLTTYDTPGILRA